jgi:hypothetical protein
MREQAAGADMKAALALAEGRRVLARIMKYGGRGTVTLDAREGCGPVITAFNEGRRAVADCVADAIKEAAGHECLARCEMELEEWEAGFAPGKENFEDGGTEWTD